MKVKREQGERRKEEREEKRGKRRGNGSRGRRRQRKINKERLTQRKGEIKAARDKGKETNTE